MVGLARQRHSFAEYLELEAISRVKHEYLDGQVWAMAGGTPAHAAITVNVSVLLAMALRDRPCQVFSSDLRVRVQATGLATYPDITVVCGALETDPDDRAGNTAINPLLIVEVLSPSTEDYDRGEKLSHYKHIPSVREILLIAHDERRIESWRRSDSGWTLEVARAGVEDRLHLAAVECTLELAEVYRNPLAR
ncbi:MAG: Uma2 family endonuclease [Deltaproteobacteria bacterium]|nr:Uma2 family endonuclease [Deltaproteobacteria bacterium]